jgi:hypothetical protein
MSQIIDALKQDHVKLIDFFCAINDKDITNAEIFKSFHDIKDLLLLHILKEDETIYPVLNAEANLDQELRKHLDFNDLAFLKLSTLMEDFMHNNCESNIASEANLNQLDTIFQLLGIRISHEEGVLFNKYEELVGNVNNFPTNRYNFQIANDEDISI